MTVFRMRPVCLRRIRKLGAFKRGVLLFNSVERFGAHW